MVSVGDLKDKIIRQHTMLYLQCTSNGGVEIQVKLNSGGLESTVAVEDVSRERVKFIAHL